MTLETWKQRAGDLKRQVRTLVLAYGDPRVPWYAKAFAACVVAYAFSPIDLIPDFIPVLGYLDDLILVPLGIALAIRMIPPDVWKEAQARADAETMKKGGWAGAVFIVALWVLLGWLSLRLLWPLLERWWA